MNSEERARPFCRSLLKFHGVLLLLYLQSGHVGAYARKYIIDTTTAQISPEGVSSITQGNIKNRTFHGPNKATWNYSVAEFNLSANEANDIFNSQHNISIRGMHALSVTVQGNFTVGSELDVSGKDVDSSGDKPLFWLGGFVRLNKSCCTLGAGPGGAFSFHGGGHGGRGGGFYQDRNTSRLYGWSYYDTSYLLGGSTGTVLFTSKSGSGGGAIELIAEGGTLTINAAIKADGYSSGNTSDEHCAGSSSGGLIRLQGDKVVITSNGNLSAVGGDSGRSSNHSHYCGGGGGGGVIQVFSLTDNKIYKANSSRRTRGGRGLHNGETGLEQVALYFDREMELRINTTSCKMTWSGNREYVGVTESRTFNLPKSGSVVYEVCEIKFISSIFIGRKVRVNIRGKRALSLISTHGNIEINSRISINGSAQPSDRFVKTSIGGYVKTADDGENAGPANISDCSSDELYGRDFEALLGGSVCSSAAVVGGSSILAVGGGALELKAENGAIVIDDTISADGFSNNTSVAGAMGGTIRLHAREIHLRKSARLTARGSVAGGGVIQMRSGADVQGVCESKFDVTGSKPGLINILVSTADTFQVQYIQEGYLEIDTTNARWMHKLATLNGSMAYSYYGQIEERISVEGYHYNVTKFEFRTPILINGSARVEVSGLHSLLVSSKEGIFIGVNIDLGKSKATLSQRVGGYCISSKDVGEGKGPGRGRTGINAGAGHGGKGGLLFEDDKNVTYSRTYGIQPDVHVLLIGGSTGSSNCSSNDCTKEDPELVVACGGGAIEIRSSKNLTINAEIRANGETVSILSKASSGGSSGGTIILNSTKHVILRENAKLEARGADARAKNGSNSIRGGGGGGVIAIYCKGSPVGTEPSPDENTAGGKGTANGDNGLVVINENWTYGYPTKVIEVNESYVGCVNASIALSAAHTMVLKAHEASPSKCINECFKEKLLWAYIKDKTCKCSNSNATWLKEEEKCDIRCWSNSSLICGGKDAFSAYKTGYVFSSSSSAIMSSATSAIRAIFPSTTVEVVPSSSVSVTTKPTEKPETTEEPEPTTKSPTEPSEKFKEISNVTITDKNVVDVVEKLKNLTSEEQMNGGDTKVALEILQKLTCNDSLLPKDKGERQKLGQNILEVASSLLSKENVDSWGVPTQKENTTGKVTSQTQVLELVENIGLKIGEQLGDNDSLVIESTNIAMGVETRIPDESAPGAEYPNYNELGSEWKGQDRVFVHKELFDEMATDKSSRTTVVYAIYNHISEHFPTNTINKESSKSMIVNSRILALKFNKQLTSPLKTPINLWFDKLKTKNVTKPSCSFVDFKNDRGSWSDTGCRVVKQKEQDVKCACDHLTNFAILMQVKEFEIEAEHMKALTVITYVGCGISLFGLALTLATFLSLETLASERTSIHKNLVVAIGLAQIVFLAGIDATYNPIACKAVALFLHYLYTAAFTWMLCEGIHLYSKVVEVFSEGSKMKYYYALGWGLPLTIVFISACSRWGGYGNERSCWISIIDGLIWAFVAPVLIVMTINFVVMIMVIRVIISSVTSLQNPGNTSQVRAGVKGMIVLLPLLGLTWVFGLLAINKDTIVFQYLFAILNSLQGLFIFAFHCIGNSEVRVAYKRLHEKRTLAKSLPEHSLSTSHHPSREKRRMDSHETNFTGDDDIIVTKTIRSVSDVKIIGDNMALQTFGDTDSGRWSLNCPSPDPFVDLDHAKRA